MKRQVTPLRALVEAMATLAAALASVACTHLIAPGAGPAVMAVVLTLSLSRSQLDQDLRGRLEAALVLPLVGMLAMAVGFLLHRWPWLGAAVFTAGMSLAIWLRRFGPLARRAGSLIALPFVTLLTVPHIHAAGTHGLPGPLVPIVVAWIALFWVGVAHAFVRLLHGRPVDDDEEPPMIAAPQAQTRLHASTRMAVQMAVALALAFVTGFLFFPERWSWIVLTAFIVNIGNRGRLDVLHKSGMRVLGAGVGTVMALMLSQRMDLSPVHSGALIFVALFLGTWLRPFAYAWWALFVTVALALLQGFESGPPAGLLVQRLEEIAIGAVIGVCAAWFVLPVRSTDVVRRRLASALAALSDALDPAHAHRTPRAFGEAMDELALIAPPFRLAGRLTRHPRARVPAQWIDTLLACRVHAEALIARQATPGYVRQAVGDARRALREPERLLGSLEQLRGVLGEREADDSPHRHPRQSGDPVTSLTKDAG